jgi:hypothetical protein
MRAGGEGCGVSANEYSCAHGAQKNYGDLTPYLTYDYNLEWKSNAYLLLRIGNLRFSVGLGRLYSDKTPVIFIWE